ncbi:hypothetical protein RvY_15917-3 [Ramazzottius varieornatus]|uniref:Uncharacterized protein n=1 Tax=Ramazzottius varieornatus TaxID=947166 RepID=A0A1D1W162_RAMVA|nr:hypothetical protein RvY_15917-3 [Ramazzottius varieornatus]
MMSSYRSCTKTLSSTSTLHWTTFSGSATTSRWTYSRRSMMMEPKLKSTSREERRPHRRTFKCGRTCWVNTEPLCACGRIFGQLTAEIECRQFTAATFLQQFTAVVLVQEKASVV